MNFDAMRFWLELANIGVTMLVGLYVWVASKNRVTHSRITLLEEDIDRRIDGMSERLTRCEEGMRHLPTHADFIRVHERLDKQTEETSEIKGTLKRMSVQLDMLNSYLLNGDRK